VAQRIESAG